MQTSLLFTITEEEQVEKNLSFFVMLKRKKKL